MSTNESKEQRQNKAQKTPAKKAGYGNPKLDRPNKPST